MNAWKTGRCMASVFVVAAMAVVVMAVGEAMVEAVFTGAAASMAEVFTAAVSTAVAPCREETLPPFNPSS
jgi:hypothetical protein